MNNRTVGIIATVVTALICGCSAIMSCVWGGLIATNTPINVTSGGVESSQTLPAPVGYVLLCLSIIFVIVPIAVGFFTLRKKPDTAAAVPTSNPPLPPTS